MPLDFPTSPTLNEIYTFGGRSWQWNGTAWDVYSAVSGNVVTQLNGLTGGITLAAGSNITLTPVGNTITIDSSGGGGGISGPYVVSFNGLTGAVTGVSSINGKTGAINFEAGSGITLSVSGNTFTITSTSSVGGTYYNFTESTSAPVGPTAGDRWFDTNTGKFFTAITDSGSNIWIESGGVGSGNATTTTTLDFSGQINQIALRVTGTGVDYGTSLTIFNTPSSIQSVTINASSTPSAITLSNIVSKTLSYDSSLGWVLEVIAKPPFALSKTAEQLYSETFTDMTVDIGTPTIFTTETWNTFDNLEILHKPETYLIKTLTGLTWATADTFITCKIMGLTSADHTAEDAILEGVQFEINNIVPTVGFDIIGHAPNGTYGKYTVKCLGQ